MKRTIVPILVLLATLAACNRAASNGGQIATLALKDGTTVTGTVTKSDASSITIQTPSGVVSTYPTSQVGSISYSDAAANGAPGAPNSQPATTAATPPPAQPPAGQYTPAATFLTIPSGVTIAVRTDQTIDSQTAASGQTYPGTVAREVRDDSGRVAIPRGSRATLVIRDAQAQGRIEGQSELAVDVAEVQVAGRHYRLETTDFVEKGRQGVGANQRTAKFAGGGGALGGIIGAIAGGGKGAAIGALSGAAAGTAAQSVSRGKGVRIPAETVLNFRLEAPIRIREMQ